jgi:enoyl-CoA hydratase
VTDEPRVLAERDGGITTLTINRPKALNALDEATMRALLEAFAGAAASPDLRCVILTGAGEKAFVAGADITAMANLGPRQALDFVELAHSVCDAIEALPVPVIAAVGGFALGGGCELALACDFIYAAKTARFGQPEVNLGVIPGIGGTQRLPRRIGLARASELIYTGDVISADEALRIGLCNRVVEPGELMPAVRAVAAKIAGRAPLAVSDAKRAMVRGASLPLGAGNELERHLFAGLFGTEDQREGMSAFVAKRPAAFKGR